MKTWQETYKEHLTPKNRVKQCTSSELKTEIFQARLAEVNPNVKVVGILRKSNDTIECECKMCQHIWNPIAKNILNRKSGCPICSRSKRTPKEFNTVMRTKHPTLTVLGVYKNSKEPIEVECNLCGTIWSPLANNILNQSAGCKYCKSIPKENTK